MRPWHPAGGSWSGYEVAREGGRAVATFAFQEIYAARGYSAHTFGDTETRWKEAADLRDTLNAGDVCRERALREAQR